VGSLGGAELVFVLVLALLLFGPRRLPQIARTIGKTVGDLRKATTDFKSNLEREVDLTEVRDLHGNIKSAGREIKDTVKEVRDLGVAHGSWEPAERIPPTATQPAPEGSGTTEKPSTDGKPERDS
jgi:Tat protein translocase TatB subunit